VAGRNLFATERKGRNLFAATQTDQLPPGVPDTFREPTVAQGLGEAAGAITDPIATALTGLAASGVGGLAAVETLLQGGGVDLAVNRLREIQKRGTFDPSTQGTEAGAQSLQSISESAPIQALETGTKFLGDTLEEGGLFPPGVGGAIGTAIPEAIGLATGVRVPGAAGVAKTAAERAVQPLTAAAQETGQAVSTAAKAVTEKLKKQSPTKQKIAQLIEEGSDDVSTAKFKLEESINAGAQRIVKDPVAVETIKQGFDEGVIAAIKGAPKAARTKMLQMVDILERGKANARVAIRERPTDVAGDSLLDRFKIVSQANRKAGSEIDSVAKSLVKEKVDITPAVDKFVDDLDSIGVTIDSNLKPNFSGSDIEFSKAGRRLIKDIVARLNASPQQNAFSAHRLKRLIDETVTFGKNARGLAGRSEFIVKSLRRNIDQTLDTKFPEYNRVNTTYAETIEAIDSLQDVAGRKMDLTGANADKAVGTLLRRLMGNAQSRVILLDSVDLIESVAQKNVPKGTKILDDDLLSQVLFADELDAVFKPVARTSFQGQIGQAIDTGAKTAMFGPGMVAIEKGAGIAQGLRGINEANALKSIKQLLSN